LRLERDQAWDLSLGPAFGAAGSTTTLSVQPQCLFRVEKVIATDTGSPAGSATRIMQFMVGNRLQRPSSSGSTTVQFFGPGVLGNGMRWDTCQQGLSISVQVSFVQDATFDMSLFGRAVT
jgi:hypothetical protein